MTEKVDQETWDIFQKEWMKLVERDRALGHIANKTPKEERLREQKTRL